MDIILLNHKHVHQDIYMYDLHIFAYIAENFIERIHISQNNTYVLFSDVYKKMDGVAREPVSQLFQDLLSYMEGRQLELESKISEFFDELFPLVYHHSINPNLKDFSADYKECLRQTRREIRPFGDIADRATQHLVRSFTVARTLLDAFELGVEVITATSSMRFRPECDTGLMRMVYCSHCSGFARTKPCGGYCLNVVRGCLAHVAELDQPWSNYVKMLERLVPNLLGSYNIEDVLSVLDTKISEAIMYAMENGPDLSKKITTWCDLSQGVSLPIISSYELLVTFERQLRWFMLPDCDTFVHRWLLCTFE
ncbi:glypican-5 [Caerostris darwini]|uniref:Glypican-5 n=1 Tax=Caerostris darwini TaxID=1538125 RepID=A0AAV4RTI5_9ARAC|nr:glypican-5 [Caerostris darwini]